MLRIGLGVDSRRIATIGAVQTDERYGSHYKYEIKDISDAADRVTIGHIYHNPEHGESKLATKALRLFPEERCQ